MFVSVCVYIYQHGIEHDAFFLRFLLCSCLCSFIIFPIFIDSAQANTLKSFDLLWLKHNFFYLSILCCRFLFFLLCFVVLCNSIHIIRYETEWFSILFDFEYKTFDTFLGFLLISFHFGCLFMYTSLDLLIGMPFTIFIASKFEWCVLPNVNDTLTSTSVGRAIDSSQSTDIRYTNASFYFIIVSKLLPFFIWK